MWRWSRPGGVADATDQRSHRLEDEGAWSVRPALAFDQPERTRSRVLLVTILG